MNKTFNPKVSIVIPVYNGSNYLKEAIDSALAQTYNNIEIIVINDGSNDRGKTEKICKSYGDKIRYFKKDNGGPASALNMGIEKMEGEYFSWLSHDDVYYPEKVEKQVDLLSKLKDKKIILFSNYDIIDKNSIILEKGLFNHKELTIKPEYSLLRGTVNGITLLIPKKAFTKHGKFNELLKCTQDYEMWNRIKASYKFVHMEETLVKSRRHPEQDSNKHPNVIKEGDSLWINMMESLSKKDKERLEGSEYDFYKAMKEFLCLVSPYRGAIDHTTERIRELVEIAKEQSKKIMVTVLIPLENNASQLSRSIDSVMSQSHNNLEIIFICEQTFKNKEIIEKLAEKDNRIQIIYTEKGTNLGEMLNIGIKSATGEYISFLDVFDEYLLNKIRDQLAEMYLSTYPVFYTGNFEKQNSINRITDFRILGEKNVFEIIINKAISMSAIMIKTEYIKTKKLAFRQEMQVGSDICFWLEVLKNTKIIATEKPLTIVDFKRKSSAKGLEKHLEELTNILGFLLTDKKYSKNYQNISELCSRYYELYSKISSTKEPNYIFERKPILSDKVSKLIYLFKYQGIPLTIKKIIWKYGPKAINKAKRVINGKR